MTLALFINVLIIIIIIKDVHTWCQECHQCQSSKDPPARPHGRLQKVITGEPLDIVAIDILSGLPLATDGSKHILVAKWSEAYPLPDAEAHTCMTALYNNFFSRFGLPEQDTPANAPHYGIR